MAITENGKRATEVCAERLTDISALFDQIGQELNARFNPIDESGADWSDAAELGRIRDSLVETLQNLSGFSQKEIENTLGELRG